MSRTGIRAWFLIGPAVLGLLVALSGPAARAGGEKRVVDLLNRGRALMGGSKQQIRPGDWVAYIMTVPPKATGFEMPIDLKVKLSSPIHVDADRPLAKGQLWLEFEFSMSAVEGDEEFFAMKVLIEGDPNDSKSVRRMFIQHANRQPMELPLEELDLQEEEDSACDSGNEQRCTVAGGKVERFAPKKVYTKMGWIKASRMLLRHPDKDKVAEFWVSSDVPLFGVVKATLGSNMRITLDGFGTGALSRIDETKSIMLPSPKEMAKLIPQIP